jgi:hypothetical protein
MRPGVVAGATHLQSADNRAARAYPDKCCVAATGSGRRARQRGNTATLSGLSEIRGCAFDFGVLRKLGDLIQNHQDVLSDLLGLDFVFFGFRILNTNVDIGL